MKRLVVAALLAGVALAASAADRGPVSLCLSPTATVDALESCRTAQRLDLPPLRARNVRLALARALVRAQRYPDAVEAYRDAVRLAPDDAESRLRLGEALLHLEGDPQAAVEELQVALGLDPQSARAYGALGAALHAVGQHPEAAAAFAEAARLDPSFFANRPAAEEQAAASKRGEAWPPPPTQPASGL